MISVESNVLNWDCIPTICFWVSSASFSISKDAALNCLFRTSISFLFSSASLAIFSFLLRAKSALPTNAVPPIAQPTGPASANKALPATIPPPPAARAPPPNQAKAALVAAAPPKAEIAVPVDAEVYGVGFKYEPANQPFHLGATYIGSGEVSALKALGGDKVQDIRVSGDYQVTPALKLGALYQNTDYGFDDNENGATVSASYKTATPWTVYGQADWVDNYLGQADSERTRGIIGGKYAFNSRTNGHVYGAYLKDEKVLNLSDKEIVDGDSYGVGAGIEYKF